MNCIWAKDRKISNDELCFVLKTEPVVNPVLSVVARDIFNVYVNGKFVCYGPARAGHGRLRVEKIDLDGYLTEKENVIVVDVISYYTIALAFTMEDPLFGAELTAGGTVIKRSEDFSCYVMTDRVIKTERPTTNRGFLEYYVMNCDRRGFYAGDTAGFPEIGTESVICPELCDKNVDSCVYEIKKGRFFEKSGVKYVDNPPWVCDMTALLDDASSMHAYDRKDCEKVVSYKFNNFKKVAENAGDADGFIYDFGRDITGKIRLKIRALSDCTINCIFDEVLINGDVIFNRESIMHGCAWEVKKGEYELDTAEPYTFRYVKFVIEGQAEIDGVFCVTIENPDTGRFSFTCAEKDLEKIVIAAKHTLEQNAVDILTDCPSRERSGWLCDSYFSSQAERFFTGENKAEYNHLENYAYFTGMKRLRPKVLPECYPSETRKGGFIPTWLCWLVFEIAAYFKRTGDVRLLGKAKEKVADIIDFFSEYENESGLLEDLPGWVFIEWSKANEYVDGVNFPTNMIYGATLKAAGELLGDRALAEKGEDIKKKVRELSFDGEFFADHAVRENGKLVVRKEYTETCQYYALFFGVVDIKKDKAFADKMMQVFGIFRDEKTVYPEVDKSNMFIGNFLRLEILRRGKRYDKLIEESREMFLKMVERTSSLWENRIISEQYLKSGVVGSCCHGFASVIGVWLAEAITGYKGYNASKKEIYLDTERDFEDFEISVPIESDKTFVLAFKNGELTYILPEGYKIVKK